MKRSIRSTADREYDVFRKAWVHGDEDGLVDGLPIVTPRVCRLLRTSSPKRAAEEFRIPAQVASEWIKKAKRTYLELFDSRSKYKRLGLTNFEDESDMEGKAVHHADLNLPRDAMSRYFEVHTKRVMENGGEPYKPLGRHV